MGLFTAGLGDHQTLGAKARSRGIRWPGAHPVSPSRTGAAVRLGPGAGSTAGRRDGHGFVPYNQGPGENPGPGVAGRRRNDHRGAVQREQEFFGGGLHRGGQLLLRY